MWEDEAIEYWCSTEGGRYHIDMARAKWAKLKSDVAEGKPIPTDEKRTRALEITN